MPFETTNIFARQAESHAETSRAAASSGEGYRFGPAVFARAELDMIDDIVHDDPRCDIEDVSLEFSPIDSLSSASGMKF